MVGMNVRVPGSNEGHVWSDPATVSFGAPGACDMEIDLVSFDGSDRFMIMTFGSSWINAAAPSTIFGVAVGQDLSWSGSNFSGFTGGAAASKATPPAAYNVAPFINEISWANTVPEGSGIYWWQNIGPTGNYQFFPSIQVTASGTGVVYNGNEFLPYTGGVSGASIPNTNFASATTPGQVVSDSGGTLQWMFMGQRLRMLLRQSGTLTAAGPQGLRVRNRFGQHVGQFGIEPRADERNQRSRN